MQSLLILLEGQETKGIVKHSPTFISNIDLETPVCKQLVHTLYTVYRLQGSTPVHVVNNCTLYHFSEITIHERPDPAEIMYQIKGTTL